MSYQRSRIIPSSSNGGTTIAADPTAEGSARRGGSRSIRNAALSSSVHTHRKKNRTSMSRSISCTTIVNEKAPVRRRRSSSVSLRRQSSMPTIEPATTEGNLSGDSCMTSRSSAPSLVALRTSNSSKPLRAAMKKSKSSGILTAGTLGEEPSGITSSSSAPSLVALRTSKTAKPLRSAMKKSQSSGILTTAGTTGKQQSKASLGILAIASGANLTRTFKQRRVTFDTESIKSTSSTGSLSSSSPKSSVEESVKRMKSLQNKYRRSSLEGVTILEAEQARFKSRLAKEVPLLFNVTPPVTLPAVECGAQA